MIIHELYKAYKYVRYKTPTTKHISSHLIFFLRYHWMFHLLWLSSYSLFVAHTPKLLLPISKQLTKSMKYVISRLIV